MNPADFIAREILLKAPLELVWRTLANAGEFSDRFGVALKGKIFAAGQRVAGQITYPGYEQLVFAVLIEQPEPEFWRQHNCSARRLTRVGGLS